MDDYFGLDDSLLRRVGETIDEYCEARIAYWSEDATTKALLEFYESIAQAFLRNASTLSSDSPNVTNKLSDAEERPWNRVLRSLEKHGEIALLFDQAVEIGVLEDAWQRLQGSGERCLELARHILSTRPSETVQRYLTRLSRCYIAGFMPECVILCRAILENAVTETFEHHSIPLPETKKGQSAMRGQLKAAQVWDGFLRNGIVRRRPYGCAVTKQFTMILMRQQTYPVRSCLQAMCCSSCMIAVDRSHRNVGDGDHGGRYFVTAALAAGDVLLVWRGTEVPDTESRVVLGSSVPNSYL